MAEFWQNIADHPKYLVSTLGRVKSTYTRNQTNSEGILKQYVSNSGYLTVHLFSSGNKKLVYVHRLVAKAFLPNPLLKKQVNHIDGCKSNNNLSNLEWCTGLENKKHASLNNLTVKGERNGRSKLTDAQVIDIINSKLTVTELAKKYNVTKTTVSYIINGKTWKHLHDRRK